MKILIADKLSSHVRSYLDQNNFELMEDPSLKDESLLAAISSYQPEVLVIRSTKVRSNHIVASSCLALIIRAGAGVNNIDMTTASAQGVFVSNCPGRNAIAVAELVIGHLINLDRRLADNISDFRQGIWAKKKYAKAKGLYGQTLAILGLGAIGKEVMKRAQAFGLKIQVWSIPFSQEEAEKLGVSFAKTVQDAVSGADILTVHLPLVDETRGLVNSELIALMNDHPYVINASRGELIDEASLLQSVHSKNMRLGLDVFCNEPNASDTVVSSPWCTQDHVYVSHHIGASTQQAIDSVGDAVISIIKTWKEQGKIENCVNLAKHSPATHCLTIRHADRVGVLAAVLDLLKEQGYNIQEMENIIFQGGKAACARIQVLGSHSTEVLIEGINALPYIYATSLSEL
jgi:D-3-phosphoglycerate dehydrogenase / 2-oxoglutarate reductase